MSRAGVVDDSTILEMKEYSDELTFAAVSIACELLAVELDHALKLFGAHFAKFAESAGFFEQLKSLGTNIRELLNNLDELHSDLGRDFRSATFPSFRVEQEADSSDSFQLVYCSTRLVLEPFLKGVLVQIADSMFNLDLQIETVDRRTHEIVLRLTARQKAPRPESRTRKATSKRLPFFHFHNALVSCCRSASRVGPRTWSNYIGP